LCPGDDGLPERSPARRTRWRGSTARWRPSAKPALSALKAPVAGAAKPKVTEILSNPRLRPVTLLLAFGYMFHTITFYYILKWAVKIVADYPPGYSQPEAASVLTYANIGGALGGLLFGFLMKRWHIKGPTVAMLLLGIAAVTAFGSGL
jgi:predicted MFS family arabinose efflux permease